MGLLKKYESCEVCCCRICLYRNIESKECHFYGATCTKCNGSEKEFVSYCSRVHHDLDYPNSL